MLTRGEASFLTAIVIAALEPVSWITSRVPPCLVNPDSYGALYAKSQECPALHVVLVKYGATIFQKLGDPVWATVAATIVIAMFTGTLWWSTHKLWRVTDQTLRSTERNLEASERAYIFHGYDPLRFPRIRPFAIQ
jgi:hypothetical protein